MLLYVEGIGPEPCHSHSHGHGHGYGHGLSYDSAAGWNEEYAQTLGASSVEEQLDFEARYEFVSTTSSKVDKRWFQKLWQTNNNQDNKGLSTDCDHEYRSSQAGGGWVNLYILSKHSLSLKLLFLRYGTQEHALETPKDVFLFGRGGPPSSKTICFPPILDWASIMLRWPREHVLHIKSGWRSCPESSGARLDFLLIKTIMPMTMVIMISFMAMMMTMMMMTIRKPSDQVKFANISVGGRECRTVHDPVTGRSPPFFIFIPSSSPSLS